MEEHVAHVKVKICGLTREEEAQYLNDAGADYAGFVFYEESKRNVSIDQAVRIKKRLNPSIRSVAVTVDPDMDMIKKIEEAGFDIIQIHGRITKEEVAAASLPVWAAVNAKTSDEAITLTFNIKNTGNVAADEVAQLYLSPTAKDQNIRPIQMQGFARVHLEKGETKTVSIKMYTEQFGFYTNTNGNRQWNIAPGKFTIKIGASSQDIKLKQDITLTGDKQNKPLREFYFSETTVK